MENYYLGTTSPEIMLVSPPPYGSDDKLQEKYKGAGQQVEELTRAFAKVAWANGISFIDILTPLKPVFEFVLPDGVHLTSAGQQIIAEMIDECIRDFP